MNLVVAVKAERKRQARVTAPNRVTLLLTASEEAADTTILHRDKSYINKLEGTCFTCSKLNANPPQSVCDVVIPENPPKGCAVVSDPCNCADCPPPPPVAECACISGYPALIPGLGSGYWIGLQANTYYSIVPNGGWVVAVGCDSGAIIGAFPVTGSNYGYGRGTILGNSVMIYPAGAIRGAGYYPANDTSFPVLALLPADGDAIIDTSFNIITDAPGCPVDNPDYFCAAEDSFIYGGYPKSCLAKYPRQESGCATFDQFFEWPADLPYDTTSRSPTYDPYYINMAGVSGFNGELIGSIAFETSSGKKYCGTIKNWTQQPSDALSGLCGAIAWVDTPIAFYSNCVDCSNAHVKVACQYLLNLTNGSFNYNYGGYNSAGNSGFYGIGPALPPTTIGLLNGSYSNHWQTFWNWTPTASDKTDGLGTPDYYYYGTPVTIENTDGTVVDNIAFIPPIGSLLENCKCSEYTLIEYTNTDTNSGSYYIETEVARQSTVTFIERFFCCEDRTGSYPIGLDVVRPFIPAWSGCGVSCYPKCVNPKCSCEGNSSSNLGKPDIYGYTPCTECDSIGQYSVSGIWWVNDLYSNQATTVFTNTGTGLTPPSERNTCTTVYNSYSPQCIGPCSKIFVFNGEDWEFDPISFEACTGFTNINEFLLDPCSRTYYLPAYLRNCQLEIIENTNGTYDYGSLLENVIITSDCGACDAGTRLIDCICPNPFDLNSCFVNKIGGPFSLPNLENGLPCYTLNVLNECSIPRMGDITITDCDALSVTTTGLTFVKIKNERCFKPNNEGLYDALDPEVADPCACCDPTVDPNGGNEIGVDYDIPSVNCDSTPLVNCQNTCCQGNGCATGNCDTDPEVVINDKLCGG